MKRGALGWLSYTIGKRYFVEVIHGFLDDSLTLAWVSLVPRPAQGPAGGFRPSGCRIRIACVLAPLPASASSSMTYSILRPGLIYSLA